MLSINITTQPAYQYHLDEAILNTAFLQQCQSYQRCVLICDENVWPLHGEAVFAYLQQQALTLDYIVVPAGETHKNRATKAYIEEQLFALHADRHTGLLALGGGVICDLVGFVAATYMRGIDVLYLPTTLLAMVDACIGGKTGINTAYGKNTLGTFSQPKAVFADVRWLITQTDHDYRAGFAEMLKHACLFDTDFFAWLHEQAPALCERQIPFLLQAIARSCELKRDCIVNDVQERGQRTVLNLGHTLAHAIERVTEYQVAHGYAVAWGLLLEARIACWQGILADSELACIHAALERFDLLQPLPAVTGAAVWAAMQHDKKNQNQQPHCVLLQAIGQVYTANGHYAQPVSEQVVLDSLCEFF